MMVGGGTPPSLIEIILGSFGEKCSYYGKVKTITDTKIDACLSQELRIIEMTGSKVSQSYEIPVTFNYTYNKECSSQIGQEELLIRGDYTPKVGEMNGGIISRWNHETIWLNGHQESYIPVCKGTPFQEYYINGIIITFFVICVSVIGLYFKKSKHKK